MKLKEGFEGWDLAAFEKNIKKEIDKYGPEMDSGMGRQLVNYYLSGIAKAFGAQALVQIIKKYKLESQPWLRKKFDITEGTGKEFDKIQLWIEDNYDVHAMSDEKFVEKLQAQFKLSHLQATEELSRFKNQWDRSMYENREETRCKKCNHLEREHDSNKGRCTHVMFIPGERGKNRASSHFCSCKKFVYDEGPNIPVGIEEMARPTNKLKASLEQVAQEYLAKDPKIVTYDDWLERAAELSGQPKWQIEPWVKPAYRKARAEGAARYAASPDSEAYWQNESNGDCEECGHPRKDHIGGFRCLKCPCFKYIEGAKMEEIKKILRPIVKEWMGGFIGTPNFNMMCPKCDMPANACTCNLQDEKEKNTKAQLPKGLKFQTEQFGRAEIKSMIRELIKETRPMPEAALSSGGQMIDRGDKVSVSKKNFGELPDDAQALLKPDTDYPVINTSDATGEVILHANGKKARVPAKLCSMPFRETEKITEKSPKGWSGTTKAMKKHKDITNPFALSYYMKKHGAKSHYKPEKESTGLTRTCNGCDVIIPKDFPNNPMGYCKDCLKLASQKK